MGLSISAGHATLSGPRPHNEDFVGMVMPQEPQLSAKGIIAAVADGVSGNAGGREASEYTVRGLLSDYYATPDTWHVPQAMERVILALHGWVRQQAVGCSAVAGMATTLTSIVLRGRFYYFSHVGDTRLYLLRGRRLIRLTTDHVWDRPEMQHVLTRAIGLDSRLLLDHGSGELQAADVFLLASDGLWAALTEYELHRHLNMLAQGTCAAEETAKQLVQAAMEAASPDNISALVLKVESLPAVTLPDALLLSKPLRVPPRLKAGQGIDGYRVEALLHASRTTLLYRVTEPGTRRQLVLKTLHPDHDEDLQERAAFVQEEWLAKRVPSRFFPQTATPLQQTYLYYLTTWHAGGTLQQQMDGGTAFSVPQVVSIATKLLCAVAALHRRGIIHRDIKPANIHLGDDGELRLLDLGVACSGLQADAWTQAPQAGTPSFLAPEQFDQRPPSCQTDLYAVGATLYLLATRHYPYGEIEPFQRPRFGESVPARRYRADLPAWLENALRKAVARNPENRFETAEEFLLTLEQGIHQSLPAPANIPLVQAHPLVFWQFSAAVLLLSNLLLLYLLMTR